MSQPRFGVLTRSLHPPTGDTTLQLEEELALAELADRLGLQEFWWGETHRRGWPVVADPMLMAARAAGITHRIRLGAAMSALTVHHPLSLVDSALQLDHLTRGRFALGLGADVVPAEAATSGYRPTEAELATAEVVGAVELLLRGHPLTMTPSHAPWTLREAAPILAPYDDHLDVRVVALADSAGPELAGHHGFGLLSAAGAVAPTGGGELTRQWQRLAEAAQRSGGAASRDRWSVVVPVHIAATEQEARSQVRAGIARTTGESDVDAVVDAWHASGRAVIGTPAMAAAHLERVVERSGGLGTVVVEVTGWADAADTRASLERLAREVIPQVRGLAAARVAAAATATAPPARRGRRVALPPPTAARGLPAVPAGRREAAAPAVYHDPRVRRHGRHAVDVPAAD